MSGVKHSLIVSACLTGISIASPALAQSVDVNGPSVITYEQNVITADNSPIQAAESQEFCITVMSGFPDDGHLARYQFFRLTEEMATDATPEFVFCLLYTSPSPRDRG